MVIDARLKSLFIFPAVGIVLVLLVFSLFQAFVSDHEKTAWLGAAIAALPLPILLGWLTLSSKERTSENLPFLLTMAAAGVMVAVWEQFIEVTGGWAPTAVALASACIFGIYVFWYSRFGRVPSALLAVGNRLPAFELPDSDGGRFSSGELLGSPAVVLFYRGNWCPLCMAQIKEMANRYKDLEAMGINIVLISPQPDEQSRKLALMHKVPFRFLVDKDNDLAASLGIGVANGVPIGLPGGYAPDTVLPTLVVTNASGTIVFSDQTDNYRVRPEPDIFLAILRRSGVVPK
ncbi:MAG: peroxiredoxin family protein [Proteobacteria bacterium]|nr:peroxiredoxin family protein [Pseudomonadota bacterium]MDA0993978.1 peroxiredoxin family protein [Pseudomonadota bacterium]